MYSITAYNLWTFTWYVHLKGFKTDKIHTEGLTKFPSNIYSIIFVGNPALPEKYDKSVKGFMSYIIGHKNKPRLHTLYTLIINLFKTPENKRIKYEVWTNKV